MAEVLVRPALEGHPGVEVLFGDPVESWPSRERYMVAPPAGSTFRGFQLWNQDFHNPKTETWDVYSYIEKRDGGTVLALLEDGRVVLVEQFKQAMDTIALEFVAFMPKGGVTEEDAIAELAEEAGIRAASVRPLGHPVMLAARKIQSQEHLFLATGCRIVGTPQQDRGEIIRVYAVTQTSLWLLIAEGRVRTAGTLAAAFHGLAMGALDREYFENAFGL